MTNIAVIHIDDLQKIINHSMDERFHALNQRLDKLLKPPERKKLTRHQTAKRLNRSLPTIDAYSEKGILKRYKQGGRYFFYEDEVLNAHVEMESRIF